MAYFDKETTRAEIESWLENLVLEVMAWRKKREELDQRWAEVDIFNGMEKPNEIQQRIDGE